MKYNWEDTVWLSSLTGRKIALETGEEDTFLWIAKGVGRWGSKMYTRREKMEAI